MESAVFTLFNKSSFLILHSEIWNNLAFWEFIQVTEIDEQMKSRRASSTFSEDAVSLRSSTPGEQGGKVGWRERLVAS